MDLIIFSALAVQCSYEVVSPLTHGGLPIVWTIAIPSITVAFLVVKGIILCLQINNNFVWEVPKYSHQLALVCAW